MHPQPPIPDAWRPHPPQDAPGVAPVRLTAGLAALVLAAACTMQAAPGAGPSAAPGPSAATSDAGLLGPTNAFRAGLGLAPLSRDATLDAAASAHARDMAANGFMDHRGSDGSTLGTRARKPGCTWTGLAENIARGQSTPEAALSAWTGSPGHRRNLAGPYERMGQARAGDVWVAVYGMACRQFGTVDAAAPVG
jgi:uncharacterized protein YkwD